MAARPQVIFVKVLISIVSLFRLARLASRQLVRFSSFTKEITRQLQGFSTDASHLFDFFGTLSDGPAFAAYNKECHCANTRRSVPYIFSNSLIAMLYRTPLECQSKVKRKPLQSCNTAVTTRCLDTLLTTF